MKLRNWWKKLAYWKKGAIIGLIFGLIHTLYAYLSPTGYHFFMKFNKLPINLVRDFINLIHCNEEICVGLAQIIGFPLVLFYSSIIGLVICLFIEKILKYYKK